MMVVHEPGVLILRLALAHLLPHALDAFNVIYV
jgi:hypothetical protein